MDDDDLIEMVGQRGLFARESMSSQTSCNQIGMITWASIWEASRILSSIFGPFIAPPSDELCFSNFEDVFEFVDLNIGHLYELTTFLSKFMSDQI